VVISQASLANPAPTDGLKAATSSECSPARSEPE
jgi:hypothetical protein